MALRTLAAQQKPLRSGSAGGLSTLDLARRPFLQVRANSGLQLSHPSIHPSIHPPIPHIVRAYQLPGALLGTYR